MENSKDKKWYIYLDGQRYEVEKAVYDAYYHSIWNARGFARRHHLCSNTNYTKCVGDCGICAYRKESGDCTSLDQLIEEHGYFVADESQDPEQRMIDQENLAFVINALNEIHKDAVKIASYLLEGMTDRQIAALLGMPKSTFSNLKLRIRKELKEKLKHKD